MIDQDLALWNKAADEYNAAIIRGDFFREKLLDIVLLQLLGKIHNKKVLDAGCGQGYFSHILYKAGAHVVGVDGSRNLIKLAKQNYEENESLKFLEHNLKTKLPFQDQAFDIILCNMVLMDFDPIDATLHEFARVLRPQGIFIFSVLHPLFSTGFLHKTIWERITHALPHYAISRYKTPFNSSRCVAGIKKSTTYYHRPISFYTNALDMYGFLIKKVEEPTFETQIVDKTNNFLRLCAEIPPFFIVKTVKDSSLTHSTSFSVNPEHGRMD